MSRTVPNWVKAAKPHFCAACGTTDDLQYHHLVPTSLGGKTEPTNIIVLCGPCHQKWHRQGGREHHNSLIKEGIARAKERGVKVGRRTADGEHIMRLIAENSTQFRDDYTSGKPLYTESEIMEMAGVENVCYHKYKSRLLALIKSDEWPFEWEKPKVVHNRPLYDRVVKNLRSSKLA